jgi:hypothetical protein
MPNTMDRLKAAWGKWHAVVGTFSDGKVEHGGAVHGRLLRFCDRHPDDPAHLVSVVASLSQGKHLVEAAVRWGKPIAGHREGSPGTPTDRARGEQFRLVMAHGGLETVLNALLPVGGRRRHEDAEMQGLLDRCGLDPYPPLPPPGQDLAELSRWLGFQEEKGSHPLTAFLKLNPSDTRTLRTWLLDGKPIKDWYAALRLAKVLRNSTVHGSLSATKVYRWGLRPTFQVLTGNIGDIVAAAFERLA